MLYHALSTSKQIDDFDRRKHYFVLAFIVMILLRSLVFNCFHKDLLIF